MAGVEGREGLGMMRQPGQRKPYIVCVDGEWVLRYWYKPRQMWLFGLDAEERQKVYDSCCTSQGFGSLNLAVAYLRVLYKSRVINLI